MKMNLKSFAAGVLVGSIGLSTVFAAPISRAINAVYSINAVTVDGRSVQFTEANKPFTVDGTTYLPVRAVAEALDKNVDFDSATATVKITSKGTSSSGDNAAAPAPVQEAASNLTVDMVAGYETGYHGIQSVKKWNTNTKDNAGNYYTTGIEIHTNAIRGDYSEKSLDVALLGNFTKFKGQLVLTEKSKSFKDEYDISILADGRELQTIRFKAGTLPQNLDLDVSGIQKLSFKFTNVSRPQSPSEEVYYGLVDVTLSK